MSGDSLSKLLDSMTTTLGFALRLNHCVFTEPLAIAQSKSVSNFEQKKWLKNESTKALEFLNPFGRILIFT
jgi:hypothetical protein